MAMEELFTKVVGMQTKTSLLFNVVHQNVVLCATFHLKKALPGPMTRDVRNQEGWRIGIMITPDFAYVTHTRREQALATSPPDEYFWFEWELMFFFHTTNFDLNAVRCKLVKLMFNDMTSTAFKAKMMTTYCHGNLIIS